MKWDTACRPADDPLWAFLSPGAQEPGSWKKYILGIHREKIIIPAPFHSKAFVLLYKFETSWALLGRLSKAFFFRLSQGPLILNILNSFSGPFLDWLWESFLVESPILYLAFSKTISPALFRTFGLPPRFLLLKPSFLHDHFTTLQFQVFSSFYISR